MHPRLSIPLLLLAAIATQACDGGNGAAQGRSGARSLLASAPTPLLSTGSPIVAKPDWISEDPTGRIVITDVSDRDVKLYGARGAAIGVLGRAGHGPGEFSALMTAQVYRDSVVAYDLAGGRLSLFGPDGRLARTVALGSRERPAPFTVRVVDDSLFLLISAIPGAQNRPLLTLVRPNGTTRSTFLRLGAYVGTNPQVAGAIGLIADAADGRVFVAVAGGDSVWAYDYDGRRLAAFPADPVQLLRTTRSLVDANGGKIRRANGGYVVDGNRMVIGLVALDSGSVALQIAPYDGRVGVDPEEGGTIIVSSLAGTGGRTIARQETSGALLGRDRRGRLLFLRYTSPEADAHELVRVSLATTGEPP